MDVIKYVENIKRSENVDKNKDLKNEIPQWMKDLPQRNKNIASIISSINN